MERIEAANPSLTVGAPNLAPEFSAMFCKDFTIEGTTRERGYCVKPLRALDRYLSWMSPIF